MENFKRAKAAGLRIGVLATMNQSNWDRMLEVIDWLQDELGERSFKANVAYPIGAGLDIRPLTGRQILKACKDVLDHVLETGGEWRDQWEPGEGVD